MPKICLAVMYVLISAFIATFSEAETVRAKTVVTSYRGYLQHPAPGEDEYTVVLWKTDPRIPGQKEGIKIIFEEAVLDSIDSMGPIDDWQFQEVILRDGIFQIIGKKIICIGLGSEDIINVENLKLSAKDAEERLNQLALSVDGYIDLGQNSLLVYKNPTGNELLEEIKFDDNTLFLNIPYGWPREHIHQLLLGKKKIKTKVGWRQPESSEAVNGSNASSADYIAGYINISVLE